MHSCRHLNAFVESSRQIADNFDGVDSVTVVDLTLATSFGIPFRYAYCNMCAKQFRLPVKNISRLKLLFYARKIQNLYDLRFTPCVICFYEKVFDIILKDDEPLPFLNQTTSLKNKIPYR